jgi:hypothetical protein
LVQLPQVPGLLMFVSHPTVGSLEQCNHPGSHACGEDGGTTHTPALHVAVPLTCGSAVQS